MTILTKVDGMTRRTAPRVGARLDGMEEFKVAPVHPLLNGITPLMTVTTEILIAMALLAGTRVLFGIDLMLGLPTGLVILRLRELTIHMAEVAIVGGRQDRIRAVVT